MGSVALSDAAERLADKGVQGPMAADILLVEDDAFVAAPKWLERDKNNLTGKVIALPARDDIDFEIAENLIVELYSK